MKEEKKPEFEEINKKEFLSIKETCVLLGISRTTLYRQTKRGEIKTINIGKRVIIKRADLSK